ncbi:hypothetical protein [Nonomuraea sp. B1E8]|uniref:hypothetical protein n=1 Tax=unclassified Nonomuraea TaxID=2593643 RepID=UPI00325DBAF7
MSKLPDFHGPHVCPPLPDAESVEWEVPMARFVRVRVLRHTCECKPCVYEFCAAGGLAWVRRTQRREFGETVRESHPTTVGKAEVLWEKLMNGQAR